MPVQSVGTLDPIEPLSLFLP